MRVIITALLAFIFSITHAVAWEFEYDEEQRSCAAFVPIQRPVPTVLLFFAAIEDGSPVTTLNVTFRDDEAYAATGESVDVALIGANGQAFLTDMDVILAQDQNTEVLTALSLAGPNSQIIDLLKYQLSAEFFLEGFDQPFSIGLNGSSAAIAEWEACVEGLASNAADEGLRSEGAWSFHPVEPEGWLSGCIARVALSNADTSGFFMLQAFSAQEYVRNINVQLNSLPTVSTVPHQTSSDLLLEFPEEIAVQVRAEVDKNVRITSFVAVDLTSGLLDLLEQEHSLLMTIPAIGQFQVSLKGSSAAIAEWRRCAATLASETEPDLTPLPTITEAWGVVYIPDFDGCAIGTLEEGRGIIAQTVKDVNGEVTTQVDVLYGIAGGDLTVPEAASGRFSISYQRGLPITYELRMTTYESRYATLAAYNVSMGFFRDLQGAFEITITVPELPTQHIELNNIDATLTMWKQCVKGLA